MTCTKPTSGSDKKRTSTYKVIGLICLEFSHSVSVLAGSSSHPADRILTDPIKETNPSNVKGINLLGRRCRDWSPLLTSLAGKHFAISQPALSLCIILFSFGAYHCD